MLEIEQKYDSLRVERVIKMIRNNQASGKKIHFELLIDDIPLTGRTAELSMLEDYETLFDNGSEKMEIVIYPSEKAKADQKFIFWLGEKPKNKTEEKKEGLSGLGADAGHLITAETEKLKNSFLQEKNNELKEQLDKANRRIEQLSEQLEGYKEKIKSHDTIGSITDNITKVLPYVMPGLSKPASLSGVAQEKEAEASFSEVVEVESKAESLTQEQKQQLSLLNWVQQNLKVEEKKDFNFLLNYFTKEPSHICEFARLVRQGK